MKIQTNTQNFLENTLKISSAICLIFGFSLIIPKIADAALTLKDDPKHTVTVVQDSLDRSGENSQDSSEYQPPNYGRPSSAYGSGTR
ncbi:MAG: hypothetical protein WBF90_13785 [Rivularia sp. (in: cyanobacteria)]|jgi:hypothetical protein